MTFTVSFLSDLGVRDAAVCAAVVHALSPDARVLDIDHELPPHDISAASFALMQVVQYLPEGALIAAVDPKAGTPEQRYIAAQAGALVILAPDNGLIAGAVGLLGGCTEAVALDNTEHHLSGFEPTFAARDRLAPAAAHLANGGTITSLGSPVAITSLVPALISLPTAGEHSVSGSVWNVDRFGNCALNITPAELLEHGVRAGAPLEVTVGSGTRRATFGRSFAELEPSELGVGTDSTGLLTLWMPQASAAEHLKIKQGEGVTLTWEER